MVTTLEGLILDNGKTLRMVGYDGKPVDILMAEAPVFAHNLFAALGASMEDYGWTPDHALGCVGERVLKLVKGGTEESVRLLKATQIRTARR